MEKMNIDWQHYHAPNKEAIKEIPSQLDYLFSANDSPENIEYFLYNELAPNIKHQFKIYDIIEPVIEVIEFNILQKGKHQYKNEILKEPEEEIEDDTDPYFENAINIIRQENKVSISLLQRKLKVGFNRASRIYDQLKDHGIISYDDQIITDNIDEND